MPDTGDLADKSATATATQRAQPVPGLWLKPVLESRLTLAAHMPHATRRTQP